MGYLHIYYGDGKGKTTAAAGLALRMLGSGGAVVFAQFLKPVATGEIRMLAELPRVTLFLGQSGNAFAHEMTPAQREETLALHLRHFAQATLAAKRGAGLLVLDEVLGAVACGLFPEEVLRAWLRDRPAPLEVVITGRQPTPALLALGDYVTEMREVRHPYAQGVGAREGIEY